MKTILLTTTSDISKCYQLKRSLIYYGWDFHFIEHEWRGFGSKIIETYNYLKAHPDITHFFYSDAWDTMAMDTMENALAKIPDKDIILLSAERACYPHGEKAPLYPENKSPWKYVNGGGWFASSELFCNLVEAAPCEYATVDQVYFTDRFLEGTHGIQLDYQCQLFQTIAFCPDSDFDYSNRVRNTVTKTKPVFIHGNGHTPMQHIYALLPERINTFREAESLWQDTEEGHKRINEMFTEKVNADPQLKAYRDWIESKIFGFGERSFLWMWKLLIDRVPDADFLEIGVFRGQILGLIRMLDPYAKITGITPLTSEGGHWESDYAADIKYLHESFNLPQPDIIKGLSTDPEVIKQVAKKRFDIIYIDGGHSYEVAKSDVFLYSSFVKIGGYLVIDDCAHKYKMPDGYFRGIESVSKAVDELLPNDYYKEVFSVVHNRVFKRIK